MATVYDLAVRKLTQRARDMAKADPHFGELAFERWKLHFVGPEQPTFGLPLTVFERALKEAFYEFGGIPHEMREAPTRELSPDTRQQRRREKDNTDDGDAFDS